VIQFALRHPERTSGLVLIGSALPGRAGRPPKPLARLIFTDVVFWTLSRYAPVQFARLLGTPRAFRFTAEQRAEVIASEESLLPVRPRKRGVLYDAYVSNPDVQRYPLEEISVPTLIINAEDDGLSAFENAARAARRIPGTQLLTVPYGGHMLLGSDNLVAKEVARFLAGTHVG
jgi:pimeloyl-ACP methyl ester carboxylesterase